VAEPFIVNGVARAEARERASAFLRRSHIPERLWRCPPSTFSGGEQQRVNIGAGFIPDLPILRSNDRPPRSMRPIRAVVVKLIEERNTGCCYGGRLVTTMNPHLIAEHRRRDILLLLHEGRH